jgi:hypothetical protein
MFANADLMEKSRLLAETNEVDTQQMSDTASSVGSEHGGGGGGNRHRASSPSLFNNEGLEELYEMLDSIEDSINLAPNEELVRSRALRLESLRDEIGRLEGKIGEAQRDYDSLAERARQMEAEVTTTSDQWEQAEERRRVLFNTLMRLRPYQQRQHRGFGNREYVDVWGLDDDLSSTGAGGDDSHLDVPFPTLLLMAQGQSRGRWLNNNYMRVRPSEGCPGGKLPTHPTGNSHVHFSSMSLRAFTAISATATSTSAWAMTRTTSV